MSGQANGNQIKGRQKDADPQKSSSNSLGRRALMVGAATAGAGAAVSLVARPEPAAAESPAGGAKKVLLSKANTATATTSISVSVDGDSGVAGIDTSTSGGYGLNGKSTHGIGVYGTSTMGTGIYGIAPGPFGAGVFGSATAEGGDGIQGLTTGENGYGVLASGQGTGDSYGIYTTSANSDALYVDGAAQVTGTLSKGGGSFKIDHPLDPEGKYLYHSFVESSEMKNVYDGTVTLNSDGSATVELSNWFEALNRDYRYQLTPIGGPAPDLYISDEVSEGAFSIAGGKGGQKVSWQVTGIRQDDWANANRIPLEVEKPAEDRGRYLHPELFGGEPITALARARNHGRRHHSLVPTV